MVIAVIKSQPIIPTKCAFNFYLICTKKKSKLGIEYGLFWLFGAYGVHLNMYYNAENGANKVPDVRIKVLAKNEQII